MYEYMSVRSEPPTVRIPIAIKLFEKALNIRNLFAPSVICSNGILFALNGFDMYSNKEMLIWGTAYFEDALNADEVRYLVNNGFDISLRHQNEFIDIIGCKIVNAPRRNTYILHWTAERYNELLCSTSR